MQLYINDVTKRCWRNAKLNKSTFCWFVFIWKMILKTQQNMTVLLPSTLISVSLLLLIIYLWNKYTYLYWHRRRIPYIQPLPFFGNLRQLLTLDISFGDFFRELHAHEATSNEQLVGFYILTTPALLVRDPVLVNQVFVKNSNMFLNRYEAADAHYDAMGALSLPLAKFQTWRESRKHMSSYFTTGQIKNLMYPQMLQIAENLELHVGRHFSKLTSANHYVIIEVKHMCALFTTDLSGRLLYGLDTKCLNDFDAPLKKQWQELLKPDILKALNFFIIFFLPQLTTLFRVKVFTHQYSEYMRKIVNEISLKRKSKGVPHGHFIDFLLDFKESFKKSEHFTNNPDYVASQAAIFLLAGFETSSSLIAFTLYELAKQPKLQQKLRGEIKLAHQTGKFKRISYESINNLNFLSMVVAEALRLYPAAAFINRECTPPTESSGYSLKSFSNIFIPTGMPLYVSILGIHRDEKYWPNPLHFDPERFSEENIKLQAPFAYIPFGSGPHSCIGSRLGILQVKLGLVYILRSYYVETCPSTMKEIKFDPKSFMLQSEGGIYLKFTRV